MKLQTLGLDNTKIERTTKKTPFWERQFQLETTYGQKVFDGLFGIILPVACFFFDFLIFRTPDLGTAMAGEYKSFAYILSFVSIMSLLAFMLWGVKLKWLNGLLCGLFAAGAVVSLIIGILLFPYSLIGLMVLIGALGFTPLFTAFVYWRNAVRTHKTVFPQLGKALAARIIILAAMFSLVIPAVINVNIQKGLNTMKDGNAAEIRQTAKWLKYLAPLVDFKILRLRRDSKWEVIDSEENKALTESYRMLTGEDIKW